MQFYLPKVSYLTKPKTALLCLATSLKCVIFVQDPIAASCKPLLWVTFHWDFSWVTYTTHVDKLASVLLLNLSFSTEACLSDKLLEVEVKPYVFSYGSLNTRKDVLSFHVRSWAAVSTTLRHYMWLTWRHAGQESQLRPTFQPSVRAFPRTGYPPAEHEDNSVDAMCNGRLSYFR